MSLSLASLDVPAGGPWPSIYDVDKQSAAICRDLQLTGFGFNLAKSLELAEQLKALELEALAKADSAVGRTIRRGKSGGLSNKDLAVAFFGDLHAPIFYKSKITGRPSLGVDALRGYAAARDPVLRALALAVLEWRRARKLRATYINAIVLGDDGRVHPSWHNYGAISGRWACQGPNLMNLPRLTSDPTVVWQMKWDEASAAWVPDFAQAPISYGIRGLYVPKRDHVLVTWDMSQLEMRMAAYASGDAVMISACEGGDLHSMNATIIFGVAFTNADKAVKKRLRTLAKSAGFAVAYMAEAATVYARILADGTMVRLAEVEAMLRKLHTSFHGYFEWQAERLQEAMRTGVTLTPILGRSRWVGHDPSPTETANHPIQGGAADLMNIRTPIVLRALREAKTRSRMVAQVHDSIVTEVPRGAADEVVAIAKRVFEAPIEIASSGRKLTASFPIDVEVTDTWR